MKNTRNIYFSAFIMFLIIGTICLYLFKGGTTAKENSGKIAFCQRDGRYWQIWIMNLDGSNRKRLTGSEIDKRSPDISGDGRRIAYVTNDGKLWVMDANGANNKQIPLNIGAAEPRWCLQDKAIVFTSYRGITFLDDSDIWMVNSDGRDLKKIIRHPSLQFLPDMSDDGKEMVFVDVLETEGHEIFKLDMETKDGVRLTKNESHDTAPVFAADRNAIVYSSDEDGNYDVWIMDGLGQNKRNLTFRPAFDSSPVITKDGKTIFFLSDSSKTMQIWSMDIGGASLKQVTNDKYDKQDISVYAP